jgi:hypothetical protein
MKTRTRTTPTSSPTIRTITRIITRTTIRPISRPTSRITSSPITSPTTRTASTTTNFTNRHIIEGKEQKISALFFALSAILLYNEMKYIYVRESAWILKFANGSMKSGHTVKKTGWQCWLLPEWH